jgi:lipopolysaccharide export system permease protein
MRILHRSILKELIFAFLLSLASLNFILMMEKLLRLSRLLSGVGTSFYDMARLILYLQPPLLLLTVPMAFLLSTLLVYGRLNVDSETVIMRTSGLGFGGIARPAATLGIFCFLLTILISFWMGPKSGIRLKEEVRAVVRERTPAAIEAGRFGTFFKDILIFVNEKPSDSRMGGVFIYDSRDTQEPRVLFAREGKVSSQEDFDVSFLLRDGHISMVRGNSTTEVFFQTYNMVVRLEPEMQSLKNADLTPSELVAKMRKGGRNMEAVCLELYRRLTLPLLCIVLVFLGPPLSMMSGKTGKLGGLTIGLSVFAAYYMILIYAENLAKAGKIPCSIGAWSSVVLLGIGSLLLFLKERSR